MKITIQTNDKNHNRLIIGFFLLLLLLRSSIATEWISVFIAKQFVVYGEIVSFAYVSNNAIASGLPVYVSNSINARG